MSKKRLNKKEIIIAVFILLGGAALTVMSFCVYYLVKPLNTGALVSICAVDFLYGFFCSCMIIKFGGNKKWLLKGFLFAVGYTVIFIMVAVAFILSEINESTIELLKSNIIEVVFYAFFTSPSMFIVLAIVALLLMGV